MPYVRLFIDTCLDRRFFDTSKIDVLTRQQITNQNETYFDTVKCTYFIKSYELVENSLSNSGTYVTLHNSGLSCTQTIFSENDTYYNECKYQIIPKNVYLTDFNETSIYSLRVKETKDKVYKIASVTENSSSEYTVFATEFCSTKFDIIEGETPKDIDTNNYFYTASQNTSIISRPPSVFFSNIEQITISGFKGIKVTWTANPSVNGYNLYIIRPDSQRQLLTRTISSINNIYAGSVLISEYNPITKQYYYIFLEGSNQVGTFQVAIETYINTNNNTAKRTSSITNKTITL